MRTLLCACLLVLASACLLEDKQVGGSEPDDAVPDPCEVYCERVSECLGEDQAQCGLDCPDGTQEAVCRDAIVSVLTCLDVTSCAGAGEPSDPCAEVVARRDEACGGS